MTPPLLEVRGLVKRWPGATAPVLDGVDLAIEPGETLALVGGSGSGKTTLARLIVRLMEPDAGTIRFAGQDLLALSGRALRRVRPRIQLVFQDPLGALNPRATVARLLADPFRIHDLVRRRDRSAAVLALLARVGLGPSLLDRHPHELSGGQRQRVLIARALATRPRLILLDEPVSALDVSIRAQILNLLRDIQAEDGPAYLFIAHDLAVVRAVAQRVAVMHEGRIVETGSTEAVLGDPRHSLTKALLRAAPRLPRPG
jgi:peptide/nickel transport system ATP-binding protein